MTTPTNPDYKIYGIPIFFLKILIYIFKILIYILLVLKSDAIRQVKNQQILFLGKYI